MSARPGVRAARLAADLARQQMTATITQLKQRTEPSRLRDDAIATLRTRADATARDGLTAARRRPLLVSGAVLAALAVIARKPLRRLIAVWRERSRATTVERVECRPAPNSSKGMEP